MRFLDRLIDGFRTPDPAGKWPPGERRTLTLDVAAGTLDGVGRGTPWEELRRFGRPANTWARDVRYFEYPALGTLIYLDEGGGVSMVELHLRDHDPFGHREPMADHRDFAPAAVRLVSPDGRTLQPGAKTTSEEVVRFLGAPAELGDLPEYLEMSWLLPEWVLDFEFGTDGGLFAVRLVDRREDFEGAEDDEGDEG
jgi:hypothetical protein